MTDQPHEIDAEWDQERDPLGWWTISGSEFLRALRMVADGAEPDMVYAEFYANSDIERPGEESA